MKKIDFLLVKSFIPPFIVTFFIALFVLIMQTLWLYIDQIMGKGADFLTLVEMIFYLSVSLIPMALPLATLISSIMVLGNLAEHYELVTLKSAGVPLLRVMRPLMFMTMGVSVFSFICSNNFIPVSNLKFKSRLHDIKQQKPTFSIEEKVFNDDFNDFVIRVGEKKADGKGIKDILIYDQKKTKEGKISQTFAKEGEMYTTDDRRFFIMNLYHGTQYEEPVQDARKSSSIDKKQTYPFIRTSFGEWEKVFDLSEFEIQWTDQELFKSHHTMLTSGQLIEAIDSIDKQVDRRQEGMQEYVWRYILQDRELKLEAAEEKEDSESVSAAVETIEEEKVEAEIVDTSLVHGRDSETLLVTSALLADSTEEGNANFFVAGFPQNKQIQMVRRAKITSRSILAQAENTNRILSKTAEKRAKHEFELHFKFSMAIICFIFLFIGAPMGAIIRKGGFGYPILISILFFMLFIVMNIAFKNISENGVIDPALAAWLPSLILFPIGIVLTIKAMNDSKIFNVEILRRFMDWLKSRFIRDKVAGTH